MNAIFLPLPPSRRPLPRPFINSPSPNRAPAGPELDRSQGTGHSASGSLGVTPPHPDERCDSNGTHSFNSNAKQQEQQQQRRLLEREGGGGRGAGVEARWWTGDVREVGGQEEKDAHRGGGEGGREGSAAEGGRGRGRAAHEEVSPPENPAHRFPL